ncbi:MAG: T9SS type A sorting domain-containing protein [Flavobacteriales bacterium]
MLYTSYIGGIDADRALGVAELNGRVVVTGTTKSAIGFDFETPAGGYEDNSEGIEPGNNWGMASGTCWLAAFDANGDREWMTLFGPYYALEPANVDFDDAGNIYLAGTVHWMAGVMPLPVVSSNQPANNALPILGGGYSQSQMGWLYYTPSPAVWTDGFYAKFASGYQLERSTLFGGSSYYDHIVDMEVLRSEGFMFIAGSTMSPQGSDPLCTQPAPNAPGFPWCPGVNPDPFFMSNTPPGVHFDGEMTAWLAQIKSTGQLMYCTSLACKDMPDEAIALSVGNGTVTVVGYHSCEAYAPEGCSAPASGLSLCQEAGIPFIWPITPNGNGEHYFVQQIRLAVHTLAWSTSIGSGPVNDVSMGYDGKIYVVGQMSSTGDVPLQEHPDYYSSVLPGTGEDQYVLGFGQGGLFWGTRHGAQENTFAAAPRTLDRIYVAGNKFNNGFVPYNCPSTIDPWCVEEAALGSITYSQLHVSLPVGFSEQSISTDKDGMIFPNPTDGGLTVVFDSVFDGPVDVRIVDASGRVVLSRIHTMFNGRANIPELDLSPGPYFIQVAPYGGIRLEGRFVVSPTH